MHFLISGFAANHSSESLQLATSMLCFMVQGLRKNFHEVVAFYPVHNFDINFVLSFNTLINYSMWFNPLLKFLLKAK